jgi:hypothetical protein
LEIGTTSFFFSPFQIPADLQRQRRFAQGVEAAGEQGVQVPDLRVQRRRAGALLSGLRVQNRLRASAAHERLDMFRKIFFSKLGVNVVSFKIIPAKNTCFQSKIDNTMEPILRFF